jgi:predicted nucleic acid-binding protein
MKSKPSSSGRSRNPWSFVKRVVADTNVLVSAIQFGGKPKQLLDLALDGYIDLALSEAILEETLRVLRDKFHRTPDEVEESDNELRVIARVVTPTETIKAVAADPSDDRILSTFSIEQSAAGCERRHRLVMGRRPYLRRGRALGLTTHSTASSTLTLHKLWFKRSTRIRVAGQVAVTRSGGATSGQSGSRSPSGSCLSPTSHSRARSWSTSWSTSAR